MNYSGGTKKEIESVEIAVNSEKKNTHKSSLELRDEEELKRVMSLFEQIQKDEPELFSEIMQINKQIIDLVEKEVMEIEDLKLLDDLFSHIEDINWDLLFWIANTAIKHSLETYNIDLLHFLVVKKGFKVSNKLVHKEILVNYFKSLSSLDFINCEDEEMNLYAKILELLISYGNADINEKSEGTLNTPLHFSVIFKQYQFIILLIKAGCNLDSRNCYNETPLLMALESILSGEDVTIYEEVAKLLINFGAIPTEEI